MNEVVVDWTQVVAMTERIHQLFTHTHQRFGATRREVQSAEQFLPTRLGRDMNFRGGRIRGLLLPYGDRRFHTIGIGAKTPCQRFKKAMRGPMVSPL